SFEAPGDAITAKVVLCTRQRSSVVAAPKANTCDFATGGRASAYPSSHEDQRSDVLGTGNPYYGGYSQA
ncbi:unnamed protein product, partial [Pylaiella littoralis]